MERISGFPSDVSSDWPLVAVNPVAVPAPTELNVAVDTPAIWPVTAAACAAVPVDPCAGVLDWPGLTRTSPSASTATSATPALPNRRRLRFLARPAAAR